MTCLFKKLEESVNKKIDEFPPSRTTIILRCAKTSFIDVYGYPRGFTCCHFLGKEPVNCDCETGEFGIPVAKKSENLLVDYSIIKSHFELVKSLVANHEKIFYNKHTK